MVRPPPRHRSYDGAPLLSPPSARLTIVMSGPSGIEPPTLDRLSPAAISPISADLARSSREGAENGEGAMITIAGHNFVEASDGALLCRFAPTGDSNLPRDSTVVRATFDGARRVRCAAPAISANSANNSPRGWLVSVSTDRGATYSNALHLGYFDANSPRLISSISPASGLLHAPRPVTILGANLGVGKLFCRFAGAPLGSAVRAPATAGGDGLECQPPHADRAGSVTVTIVGSSSYDDDDGDGLGMESGTSAVSSAIFTYRAGPVDPAVSSVVPSHGPTAGGQLLQARPRGTDHE